VGKKKIKTLDRPSGTKRKATMTETLRQAVGHTGKRMTVIAREAGVSQPILFRFVSGERDLTLRSAEKLAVYLGLELRPKT
jgi:DNA-binding phage protein